MATYQPKEHKACRASRCPSSPASTQDKLKAVDACLWRTVRSVCSGDPHGLQGPLGSRGKQGAGRRGVISVGCPSRAKGVWARGSSRHRYLHQGLTGMAAARPPSMPNLAPARSAMSGSAAAGGRAQGGPRGAGHSMAPQGWGAPLGFPGQPACWQTRVPGPWVPRLGRCACGPL